MLLFPFFLCWGSFLNVLGFRLVRNQNIAWPRSQCPHCSHTIAWYDNIPLISWVVLKGCCRVCTHAISWLYPFIEVLTASIMLVLYVFTPSTYFLAYFIFASALLVTIRSDLETMLISRFATLFLIPVGITLSYYNLLPITIEQSIAGALGGYLFLYGISKTFLWIMRKEGMGQGDVELLAFIGSFTGPLGCWVSLLLGSVLGSCVGITYIALTKSDRSIKIPFGPFLACGALCYILLHDYFVYFL